MSHVRIVSLGPDANNPNFFLIRETFGFFLFVCEMFRINVKSQMSQSFGIFIFALLLLVFHATKSAYPVWIHMFVGSSSERLI